MNLSQDYSNFFDIRSLAVFPMTQVYKDFVDNFQAFLKETISPELSDDRAATIGRTLVASMSDASLHYHTPVHVLCMFLFAEQNEIELNWDTKLAIWFHDAIYVPGQEGLNEHCSSNFMKALMYPFIDEGVYNKVDVAIRATANHMKDEAAVGHMALLDLDLCSLVFENQEVVNQCLEKECSNDVKRRAFLQTLINRGFVYRSAIFKDRFEDIAMNNVKTQLELMKEK